MAMASTPMRQATSTQVHKKNKTISGYGVYFQASGNKYFRQISSCERESRVLIRFRVLGIGPISNACQY